MFKLLLLLFLCSTSATSFATPITISNYSTINDNATIRKLVFENQYISKGVGYDFYRDVTFSRYSYYGLSNKKINGEGVIVAIIDSGVNARSSHLYRNLFFGDTDTLGMDEDGQGTYVAGIIAKMAPGVTIIPFKVSDYGNRASPTSIFKAVEHAVYLGARVINLSLKGIPREKLGVDFWKGLLKATGDEALNTTFVVGGSSGHFNTSLKSTFPENIDSPSLISVCAVDREGKITKLSKISFKTIDVCALGKDVYSLDINGESITKKDGTAQAAPFVTALVALLLQVNPELSPFEVKSLITSGVIATSQLDLLIRSGGYISYDKTLNQVLK